MLLGRGFKVFYSCVFFTFVTPKIWGNGSNLTVAYVSHAWEKTPTRYVSITFKNVLLLFASIQMSMDKVFVLPFLLISSGSFHLKS